MKLRALAAIAGTSVVIFAAQPTSDPTETTEITSETFDFDQRAGVFHFERDVRVVNPGIMTLTCGDLVAQMPARGTKRAPTDAGGVDKITANTDVRIEFISDGTTNHASGSRAVYTKTNSLLVLTGKPGGPFPQLFRDDMSITAETITLDLANGKSSFSGGPNGKPIFRASLGAFNKLDPFNTKRTNNPASKQP